jgi:hypothetical protein
MYAALSDVSCPFCRKTVPTEARQCPHCNQWLYEVDGSIRQGEPLGAVDFLIPTRVSGRSLISCYMALLGFCLPFVGLLFAVPELVRGQNPAQGLLVSLPFVGLLFAVPAIICGFVAIRRRRKVASYGAVT